jgi:hypothetical protein
MSILIDNSLTSFPITTVCGALVMLLVTLIVAIWDHWPKRRGLAWKLFVHFFLLLALIFVIPLICNMTLRFAGYGYHLQPVESPGPLNMDDIDVLSSILLMLGIALFVVFEFMNLITLVGRYLRSGRALVHAPARGNI